MAQGVRTDLKEHPSNTRKSNGSVDAPGILRRLARSRPDLLDRVETGERAATLFNVGSRTIDRARHCMKLATIPELLNPENVSTGNISMRAWRATFDRWRRH